MAYTIALIGCGRVGVWLEDDPLRVKPASHIGGIDKIRKTAISKQVLDLVAICDIDEDRLNRCSRQWQISNRYTDYRDLIDREKPDIIIIATWTSSHRDIAIYAAQKGVKGIILEKPLTTSLKSAQEVISVCHRYHVKLVVNHERRWDPKYIKTKEMIAGQSLGTLKSIYGNVLSRSLVRGDWQQMLDEVGGGPLMHDGTHLIDMIRYFCGEIATISARVTREEPDASTETTATAMMRSESGVNIFLEAGGMRQYFNFEMDLHFDKGRIKVGNGIRHYYTVQSSRRYTGFQDLEERPFPDFKRDSDPFTGAILEVIQAIEEDREPQSSGVDGLKAMEIIFGIYQSASLKGKPITLPLKQRGHPLKRMFRKGEI